MSNTITNYLELLKKELRTGHAREHSYRPFLKDLIQNVNNKINAVNEPKQQKVGAPDFVLLNGKTPIGYIETKDVNVDLDKELKTRNQVNRYKASLNNLCFTNYLEFRFYVNGEEVSRVEVAKLTNNVIQVYEDKLATLEGLLKNFTLEKTVTIKSAKELALLMANKAKMLKNTIYLSLEENTKDGQVEQQYDVFKQMLIHDLSKEQFADIYAQTVAYGMFAARYHDDSIENFTRDEANRLLPKSNPFLRNFFQSIAGYNIDDRIVWMVDDLADLFNHVNVKEILENFGKSTKQEDVIVHFYETFLGEYDQKLRKARGVYYTPQPVVDFMVRAVDDILKNEFEIKDGIADTSKIDVLKEVPGQKKRVSVQEHRVQILDPATGTGTFLDHIIKHIYNSKFKGQEGLWQNYVDNHLIPRLHGFEILMASYAMAHLKLDITLAQTGYDFNKGSGKRLGVYLTNSLEEPEKSQRDLFSQWLSQESEAANEVKKEKPIMVVIGNPPYSGVSSNKGEWITRLIEDYKYVDGKHFGEKKHWLQDDYVKFIRLAEDLIEKNGEGIIAFINNHGFLDNPTFRGMRNHLLKTFDKIYILDLHGNSKKKEISPDGSKDENVFDIQQGVSINLFIKKSKSSSKLAEVLHYNLYGKRNEKYEILVNNNINIQWRKLEYKSPNYFFVSKDYTSSEEYEKNIGTDELFPTNVTGIVTMGDSFAIDESLPTLRARVNDFMESDYSEKDLNEKFNLGKNYAKWILEKRNKLKIEDSKFVKISYRPFDDRYTYFDNKVIWRWREEIMQNFLKGENLGLLSCRQIAVNNWEHVGITSKIVDDSRVSNRTKERGYVFPLYLYSDENNLEQNSRHPNLDSKLISEIAKKLKLEFIPDHENTEAGKPGTFHPVDVLDYIYAVLHSPTYREKYKEFLKIDFPRVPFTSDQELFWKLVKLGGELRKFHLMEHADSAKLITQYPVSGENTVVKVEFHLTPTLSSEEREKTGKVYINENQYFESVSEIAWNFYIGGYQPAQKWLKDRKGRNLSYEDTLHYQKIIVALVNTDRLMKEIDSTIPEWPLK